MPLISIISPWGGFSDSNIARTQHTGTGWTEINGMIRASRHGKHIAASIAVMLLSTGVQARAAGCSFEALGEGHVGQARAEDEPIAYMGVVKWLTAEMVANQHHFVAVRVSDQLGEGVRPISPGVGVEGGGDG